MVIREMTLEEFEALPLGASDKGYIGPQPERAAVLAMREGQVIVIAETGCEGPGLCPTQDMLVLLRRGNSELRFQYRHLNDGNVVIARGSVDAV